MNVIQSSKQMSSVKHLVIGGGIVGLATAARLSKECSSTLLLEKNSLLGNETSSRNSEVIHAGIYYPKNSLKTLLCLEGNKKLYKMCEKKNISHKKITKWIVSNTDEESIFLEKMKKKSQEINQPLHFITEKEAKTLEPNLHSKLVLVSPETGIIDSHEVMNYFQYEIESNGADIALNSEVVKIEKDEFSYIVSTQDFSFRTDTIINCAGLYSDNISNLLLKKKPKQLYFFKGQYFYYTGKKLVSRLIYPAPPTNLESLGIHLTLDLSGQVKFGPDVSYLGTEKFFNYSVDEKDIEQFYVSIKNYLPMIDKDKLKTGYSGIRPKLSLPGEPFQDFYIKEESQEGFDGFVNLIGIESPGLTSSISISDYVANLLGYKN